MRRSARVSGQHRSVRRLPGKTIWSPSWVTESGVPGRLDDDCGCGGQSSPQDAIVSVIERSASVHVPAKDWARAAAGTASITASAASRRPARNEVR